MSDYEPMTARETFAMMGIQAIGLGGLACGMGLAAIAQSLPLLLVIFFAGCAGLIVLWTGCRMLVDRHRVKLLQPGSRPYYPIQETRLKRFTRKATKMLTGGRS